MSQNKKNQDFIDRLTLAAQSDYTSVPREVLFDPEIQPLDFGVLLWLLRGVSPTNTVHKYSIGILRADTQYGNPQRLREVINRLKLRYPNAFPAENKFDGATFLTSKQFIRVPYGLLWYRRDLKLSWSQFRALLVVAELWPLCDPGMLPRVTGRQVAGVLGCGERQARRILDSLPELPAIVRELNALATTGKQSILLPPNPIILKSIFKDDNGEDFFGIPGIPQKAPKRVVKPLNEAQQRLATSAADVIRHNISHIGEDYQEAALNRVKIVQKGENLTPGQYMALVKDASRAGGIPWSERKDSPETLELNLAKALNISMLPPTKLDLRKVAALCLRPEIPTGAEKVRELANQFNSLAEVESYLKTKYPITPGTEATPVAHECALELSKVELGKISADPDGKAHTSTLLLTPKDSSDPATQTKPQI